MKQGSSAGRPGAGGSSAGRMTMIAMMTVIICVCSWLTIPSAVPFTMQTFAVFCALLILGGRDGSLAIVLYILMGAIGLPVFSGFQGGIGHLAGPTGGYIIGFLLSGLIYMAGERMAQGAPKKTVALLVAGLLVCYAVGTVWFWFVCSSKGNPYGLGAILGMCVIPYVVPDMAKMALAVYVSGRVRRALGSR